MELASTVAHIAEAQSANSWVRPVTAKDIVSTLELSLQQWRDVLQRSPDNQRAKRGVAVALYKLSEQVAEKQPAQALEHLKSASAMLDSMSAEERNLLSHRRLISAIRLSEGNALAVAQRLPEALEAYAGALRMRQEFHDADPSNRQVVFDLITVYRNRGDILRDMNRPAEAVNDYRTAAGLMESLLAKDPGNIRLRDGLAQCLLLAGKVNATRGRLAEANQDSARGLRIREELANASDAEPQAILLFAFSLLEVDPASLRNPAKALTYYEKARSSGKRVPPDLDTWIAELRAQLGRK